VGSQKTEVGSQKLEDSYERWLPLLREFIPNFGRQGCVFEIL